VAWWPSRGSVTLPGIRSLRPFDIRSVSISRFTATDDRICSSDSLNKRMPGKLTANQAGGQAWPGPVLAGVMTGAILTFLSMAWLFHQTLTWYFIVAAYINVLLTGGICCRILGISWRCGAANGRAPRTVYGSRCAAATITWHHDARCYSTLRRDLQTTYIAWRIPRSWRTTIPRATATTDGIRLGSWPGANGALLALPIAATIFSHSPPTCDASPHCVFAIQRLPQRTLMRATPTNAPSPWFTLLTFQHSTAIAPGRLPVSRYHQPLTPVSRLAFILAWFAAPVLRYDVLACRMLPYINPDG